MRSWPLLFLSILTACTVLTEEPTPYPPPDPGARAVSPTQPSPLPPADLPTKPPESDIFPDPGSYSWVQIASGFDQPLALTHAGDSRLFVVERQGLIWVLQAAQVLQQPFLDIRERVQDNASERGLLGLAFHPRFQENGFFYVNYTGAGGHTIIARFQVSEESNRADPNSEQVVLQIAQPFSNHNGGGLAFGSDGMLYIGTGDGGSANDPFGNGQNRDTLLGKLLRLDVDSSVPYAIPEDNPFSQGGGLPEIWAYGLRNPWRFSFDRLTGDLFIADVGQNQWEEINYQPADSPGGINYGWDLREGRHGFADESENGLTDPIAEYSHDLGCSVTGGVVMRSASLPAWQGIYLYGDFCSGLIWGMLPLPSGTWQTTQLFDTGFRISSFGEDASGEVYLVHYGGEIYGLTSAP